MRRCPACGATSPPTQKFCGECGARLPADTADREQRKTVTVLFADVTGSTALGEALEPESLRRMLAQFFDVARTVMASHGGTVEKFIGDAVMAVFGVPVVHEDDAVRALRAALDLTSALPTLNDDLWRAFGARLQIRIGVNTGEVVTGTAERLATGDAVNVASRLEQLAPPGEIYVGAVTAELARGTAELEEIAPARLKGKSAPVRVFRLVAASSTARPVRRTPMIGRKRQLDMLRGSFDQAVDDRACVLFTVLGSAGVGKSRLVAEFLEGLDAIVVRGRCLSYGNGVGLWPATDVLRQLESGPAAADVASLLAEDHALAASARALVDGDVAVSSLTEIAWGLRRVLEHVARTRPVVVVLDDLHWAESALFEVVEHLVRLSRDAPILVLVMARPELLERREGWGTGALNTSTVLLEPLGAPETVELVDILAPTLPIEVRERVLAAAGGNPLFAEELVGLVTESDGADVRIPPTIQALLAARLDQLDPGEQRALEHGSIEGQSFHQGALLALTRDDRAEVRDRLIALVRKDVLRPDRPTLHHDEAFRFRHLLLRDAAYDRLPKSTRAELHERFARWLDEQAADLPERDNLVGYHLEQAYRYRVGLGPVDADVQQLALDAAERLEVAGRRQMLRSDLGGAIDLLERATTLRARDVLDVALELGLAGAYMMCGRPADAVSRAAAAAAAARHAGDRVGELQADLARLGFTVHVPGSGNWAPLMQAAIDEAMPVFEAADDPSALAWGWWSVTQVAHNLCRFGDAYDAASKCRDYAERSGDHFLVSQAGHISGPIAMGPKPIPEALQELTQMAAAGSHDVWIDQFIAELTGLLGRTDEAWELYRASIAAFHERGMTMAAAIAAQGGWYIAMADGDAATAIDLLRESCRQLEQMGESAFASTNAAQLADALYVTGDYEEAGQWVERALELADDSDYATQTQARGVRALLAARAGDVAAADADVDAALRMSMTMQSPQTQGALALNVAEVYRLLGRPDERREQLRQALAYFTAKESVVYAGRAAAALADA